MKLKLTAISLYLPVMSFAGELKPGSNLTKLNHDGHLREMLIRLPEKYDPKKKYLVVFGFHGAGGPKEGYHRQLERVVSKHGFISVSPQGISNARGITGWNGFSGHRISNTDAVGKMHQLIATVYLRQEDQAEQYFVFDLPWRLTYSPPSPPCAGQ
jgi:poly(3-hydroxybutyrate) depolymerase